MKIEYMLAFLGGVELMALANALSLGLLPCRLLGLIFMLAALVAAAPARIFQPATSTCEKPLTAGRTMRACARAYGSDVRNGSPRCRDFLRIDIFGGLVPLP